MTPHSFFAPTVWIVRGRARALHVPLQSFMGRSECGVPLSMHRVDRIPACEADPDLVCVDCRDALTRRVQRGRDD